MVPLTCVEVRLHPLAIAYTDRTQHNVGHIAVKERLQRQTEQADLRVLLATRERKGHEERSECGRSRIG